MPIMLTMLVTVLLTVLLAQIALERLYKHCRKLSEHLDMGPRAQRRAALVVWLAAASTGGYILSAVSHELRYFYFLGFAFSLQAAVSDFFPAPKASTGLRAEIKAAGGLRAYWRGLQPTPTGILVCGALVEFLAGAMGIILMFILQRTALAPLSDLLLWVSGIAFLAGVGILVRVCFRHKSELAPMFATAQ